MINTEKKVRTTCPFCGVGCQLDLKISGGKIIGADASASGDAAPNFGRLCVKGRFGTDYVHHYSRLTTPLIRKNLNERKRKPEGLNAFREATWDEALDFAAERLADAKQNNRGIGTFCSAKATNEDNYLFQKFIRGILKTNNVDHCARLCHAASVAGLQKALGSSAMSNSIVEMKDLELFIVTGSNTTETHPVISTFLREAVVKGGAKLIVIDPRRIELSGFATLYLQHRPGTDVALFQAMANVIVSEGRENSEFIQSRTENFESYAASLKEFTPEWAEKITGVKASLIREAARMYSGAQRAAVYWGMGISQSVHGTDNTLSLANLALLCGHLGKEGTGLNPLRGQNNVQGCSDSGGLPGVFPGYQSVTDLDVRGKFESVWNISDLNNDPGLTVLEMSDSVARGEIDTYVIMGENPMMSEPDLNKAKEHFAELETIIVIDIFLNESGEYADVVLPAVSFAEKEGTFTNSDRRVQLVRPAVESPGSAMPDWKIIQELARRVEKKLGLPGSGGFDFTSPSAIWDEMAALVPAFGGIDHARIEREGGVHWPCPGKDHPGTPHLFTDSFPRGKGLFSVLNLKLGSEKTSSEYPYLLSTGRVLYHWHGGTMTRRSVLNDIYPRSLVEINPKDAERDGFKDGEMVRVSSRRGKISARIKITERSPEGVVFIPIHFAESSVNELTNDLRDTTAKIPDFKQSAVRIELL